MHGCSDFLLVQTSASEVAGIAFVPRGAKCALAPPRLCGYLVCIEVVPTDAQAALPWDCLSHTTSRGQICNRNDLWDRGKHRVLVRAWKSLLFRLALPQASLGKATHAVHVRGHGCHSQRVQAPLPLPSPSSPSSQSSPTSVVCVPPARPRKSHLSSSPIRMASSPSPGRRGTANDAPLRPSPFA